MEEKYEYKYRNHRRVPKLNLNIPTLSSENKYWYIKEHEKPRYQLDIDKGKIYVKDVSKLEVTHYDKKIIIRNFTT